MEKKSNQTPMDEFFLEHQPQDVISTSGNYALEWAAHNPSVPKADQKVFKLLHDLSEVAKQYQQQKGQSHE